MDSFTTYNQFDKRFSIFEKFGHDRTACPLFGLLTCHNFMLNGDLSQKQHECNIQASISNYVTKELPKYMLFDELLLLTNGSLNASDVMGTTPELITNNIVGYEHMFKFGWGQNYCVLLLKNRNFIAILYKYSSDNNVSDIYAIRDCHENTQRNFSDFESLRVFLNNTYQFEQGTYVGGLRIPEFENMEFLSIEIPFELINIEVDLVDDTIEESKDYKEESTIEGTVENIIEIKVEDKKLSENMDQYIAFSLMDDDEDDDNYVNFI